MPSTKNPVTNHKLIEVILKQATLRWPIQRREEDCQENDKPEKAEREGQGLVIGLREEQRRTTRGT